MTSAKSLCRSPKPAITRLSPRFRAPAHASAARVSRVGTRAGVRAAFVTDMGSADLCSGMKASAEVLQSEHREVVTDNSCINSRQCIK